MSYSRVIEENLDILLRCTNINVKIIACIQASNGLNEDQVSEIETEKNLRKQCQLLYGWLKSSHDLFNCFVNVMEENEQLHVANFFKGNNDEPHVPMSNSRYERLIKTKPKLIDSIHYSEMLVSSLEAKKAISETDCQDVRVNVLTNYKRNYILINAIQRRSNHSFICFEEALRETHQDNAADFLYEGEVVAIHVNTNHPELDNPLSQSLNETIVMECAADSAIKGIVFEKLNGINCHLLSSKPGNSIVIFLYCKTTDDMAMFVKVFNSGRLKYIIESILNRLMSSLPNKPKEALEIELRLDDEEALLIEEFTGIDDCIPGRFQLRQCVDSDDRGIKDKPASRLVKRKYEDSVSSDGTTSDTSTDGSTSDMSTEGTTSDMSTEGTTSDDESDHIMLKRRKDNLVPSMISPLFSRTKEYNPAWKMKMKPSYRYDILPYIGLTQAKHDASKSSESAGCDSRKELPKRHKKQTRRRK